MTTQHQKQSKLLDYYLEKILESRKPFNYDHNTSLYEAVCGLNEEAGEVAGIFKKHIRDQSFNKTDLIKELGDVMYYVFVLMELHNITYTQLITENLNKLTKRGYIK